LKTLKEGGFKFLNFKTHAFFGKNAVGGVVIENPGKKQSLNRFIYEAGVVQHFLKKKIEKRVFEAFRGLVKVNCF